jgi:hypothetical protein
MTYLDKMAGIKPRCASECLRFMFHLQKVSGTLACVEEPRKSPYAREIQLVEPSVSLRGGATYRILFRN